MENFDNIQISGVQLLNVTTDATTVKFDVEGYIIEMSLDNPSGINKLLTIEITARHTICR